MDRRHPYACGVGSPMGLVCLVQGREVEEEEGDEEGRREGGGEMEEEEGDGGRRTEKGGRKGWY